MKKEEKVKIGTFNVQSARNQNLEGSLKGVCMMDLDIVLLTETKLTDDRYTKRAFGYEVCATQAKSPRQGGVAFAFKIQKGKRWDAEDLKLYGLNVIACTLVLGKVRKRLIGVYLPPSEHNSRTEDKLRKAIEAAGDPIIALGNFNVNLRMTGRAIQRRPMYGDGGTREHRAAGISVGMDTLACMCGDGVVNTFMDLDLTRRCHRRVRFRLRPKYTPDITRD